VGRSRPRNLSRVAIIWIAALLALACGHGAHAADNQRVVLIGVPGLMWSDLSPDRTPALWNLTGGGAGAAMSTRTTARAPVRGRLADRLGRAARPDAARQLRAAAGPKVSGKAAGGSASIPGWSAIKKDNAGTSYEAQVACSATPCTAPGDCTMAVGPGGVFGTARRLGQGGPLLPGRRVGAHAGLVAVWAGRGGRGRHLPRLHQRGRRRQGRAGTGRPGPAGQGGADADQRIGRVLAALPADTAVLVAGISDATATPHLHVALRKGEKGYLTATSTRRTGLVALTDVTSTVLATWASASRPRRSVRTGAR